MNRGFSLVELSIVLVILGLLTGGILAGQSLIRAAELRAVTTEMQRYQAAANTFRGKYFGIPGDMTNATKFWGDDNAACPDPAVTNGTPGTCNGNGDGTIANAGAVNATGERFQFWKQLALAGLIEGTYSGLAGAADIGHHVIGTNAPRSKISNVGWGTGGPSTIAPGSTTNFEYAHQHYFIVGAQSTDATPNEPFLTAGEAWNIDTKMDDGKPARGNVIAKWWDTCTNATSGSDLNADYLLSDSTLTCTLHFDRQY